jgi:death-on-curing protein
MEFIYFDLAHAKRTHDYIITESGGLFGEREIGNIESVIDHIQNEWYYPEFEDKLTHLVFTVNTGHAFTDGNKRTSIALGSYLLEINGMDFCIDKFIIEMENISVAVADNKIGKDLLHEIITSIINEPDFSEELKIKIIDAIAAGLDDAEKIDTSRF